jgi:hypothetical protein
MFALVAVFAVGSIFEAIPTQPAFADGDGGDWEGKSCPSKQQKSAVEFTPLA